MSFGEAFMAAFNATMSTASQNRLRNAQAASLEQETRGQEEHQRTVRTLQEKRDMGVFPDESGRFATPPAPQAAQPSPMPTPTPAVESAPQAVPAPAQAPAPQAAAPAPAAPAPQAAAPTSPAQAAPAPADPLPGGTTAVDTAQPLTPERAQELAARADRDPVTAMFASAIVGDGSAVRVANDPRNGAAPAAMLSDIRGVSGNPSGPVTRSDYATYLRHLTDSADRNLSPRDALAIHQRVDATRQAGLTRMLSFAIAAAGAGDSAGAARALTAGQNFLPSGETYTFEPTATGIRMTTTPDAARSPAGGAPTAAVPGATPPAGASPAGASPRAGANPGAPAAGGNTVELSLAQVTQFATRMMNPTWALNHELSVRRQDETERGNRVSEGLAAAGNARANRAEQRLIDGENRDRAAMTAYARWRDAPTEENQRAYLTALGQATSSGFGRVAGVETAANNADTRREAVRVQEERNAAQNEFRAAELALREARTDDARTTARERLRIAQGQLDATNRRIDQRANTPPLTMREVGQAHEAFDTVLSSPMSVGSGSDRRTYTPEQMSSARERLEPQAGVIQGLNRNIPPVPLARAYAEMLLAPAAEQMQRFNQETGMYTPRSGVPFRVTELDAARFRAERENPAPPPPAQRGAGNAPGAASRVVGAFRMPDSGNRAAVTMTPQQRAEAQRDADANEAYTPALRPPREPRPTRQAVPLSGPPPLPAPALTPTPNAVTPQTQRQANDAARAARQ